MKSPASNRAATRVVRFLLGEVAGIRGVVRAVQAAWARKFPVHVRRTYVYLQGGVPQLREEYQYIRTSARSEAKHGYYKEYQCYGGQLVTSYHYKHDQLHGKCVEYMESHDKLQPALVAFYKKGRRHGPYLSYAAWGKELQGTYIRGLQEGRWVKYREDGACEVHHYNAGRLHGEAVVYAPNGHELSRLYYEHGKPVTGTRTDYYANGKTCCQISYEGGRRQRWTQSWYSLSSLKAQPLLPLVLEMFLGPALPKPASRSQLQNPLWFNQKPPKELC